jgi:hypothetical protein
MHELKSWPEFFGPIQEGRRTHELRRNDRGFKIGDIVLLREYDRCEREFTGRTCKVEVTSITSTEEPCAVSGEALNENFCILSVRRIM